MVFRDAIKGHRLALERGGILQKDVSSGNVLIIEDPQQRLPPKGVLHDYDCTYMMLDNTGDGSNPEPSEQPSLPPLGLVDTFEGAAYELAKHRERTRTPYFMALELVNPCVQPPAVHESHHDLESFFWVFLWIILRTTDYQHECGKLAYDYTFKCPLDSNVCAITGRRGWLWRIDDLESAVLDIHHNPPLTALLHAFHALVNNGARGKKHERVPLTYDGVLHVFDTSIEQEDWPRDDKALIFDGPDMRTIFTLTTGYSDYRRIPESGDGWSTKRPLEDDGVQSDSDTESAQESTTRKRPKRIPA
ncbi:hypothetical protein TRAPUB_5743 [Trametes pubescens]|uniref:Fungal-type protein kinase domain-containing protein n=1 Tax=Trametes pubescens TaxID=154538 RepID=A0A1M2V7Q6_TRAPU|nr:hypothetical protein TRAPUB_5743 [Trametes pubescens]